MIDFLGKSEVKSFLASVISTHPRVVKNAVNTNFIVRWIQDGSPSSMNRKYMITSIDDIIHTSRVHDSLNPEVELKWTRETVLRILKLGWLLLSASIRDYQMGPHFPTTQLYT